MSAVQVATERAWQLCLTQYNNGSTEFILPPDTEHSLSQDGIQSIVNRVSDLIETDVECIHDPAFKVLRIRQKQAAGTKPIAGAAGTNNSKDCIGSMHGLALSDIHQKPNHAPKKSKERVPRPPNAFILYRQAHHSEVMRKNPGMHNNTVSTVIAQMWKAEPEAAKDIWRRKADDVKRKHFEQHPNYQYQPRRPSEKKRRMTKRKAALLAQQAAAENHQDFASNLSSRSIAPACQPASAPETTFTSIQDANTGQSHSATSVFPWPELVEGTNTLHFTLSSNDQNAVNDLDAAVFDHNQCYLDYPLTSSRFAMVQLAWSADMDETHRMEVGTPEMQQWINQQIADMEEDARKAAVSCEPHAAHQQAVGTELDTEIQRQLNLESEWARFLCDDDTINPALL